ncbi:MAG: phosphoadenosine phosphosulfate reductase family protein [Deltaproteobacteria bacterium]|nr:phosphoadenosine phosphosulfate reductase family protein [Deltaproteobacteria bacterium]
MTMKQRHIINVSGGKDSSALAIYMRDRQEDLEYVFCDTQKELPETYEYLDRLEAYLGKPIVRLNAERGFDHWLKVYGGYLPSSRMRWCTRQLKLKPFEQYVGDDPVLSYVGIRADEDRSGYVSTKPNITAVFPFKDDGITKADVFRILEESGVGVPEYYSWRTRSGCYFCFFQQREEWLGLREHHPDLYEAAKAYEKINPESGEHFTWSQKESLVQLEQPGRMAAILGRGERSRGSLNRSSQRLMDILGETEEQLRESEQPCLMCAL